MVLQPNQSTTLSVRFRMTGDMRGKHNFRVHLPNNSLTDAARTVSVLSNWVP